MNREVTVNDRAISFPYFLHLDFVKKIRKGYRPIFHKKCLACRMEDTLQRRCVKLILEKELNFSVLPKIMQENLI